MIQGFVNDNAFINDAVNIIDPDDIPGHHGHLSSEQLSFFVDPIIVKDRRVSRLPLYGVPLTSKMSLQFDSAKDDISLLLNATVGEVRGLFNLVEKTLYRVINIQLSELELELVTDTTSFPNYVPESLYLSTNTNSVFLYDVLNQNRTIVDWVRFTVTFNATPVEFIFWINNEIFQLQYNHSTISEIIPPVALTKLIDPTSIADIYQAMAQSTTNSALILSNRIRTDDSTGIVNYPTKYVEPTTGKVAQISFNILYKGIEPGVLAIRLAIKNYLLNSGVGTEALWRLRVPDLFVIAQFFVIPMWDNYTERPNRFIYPSVIGVGTIKTKVDTLLSDIPEETRYNYEILDVAYSEMQLIAVPDNLNQVNIAIRSEHPTYQRYSPQDISYQYQEVLTREFTLKLNTALAVGAGETTDETLIWNTFGDRQYVSFVINSIEYHIMSKSSYLTLIGE